MCSKQWMTATLDRAIGGQLGHFAAISGLHLFEVHMVDGGAHSRQLAFIFLFFLKHRHSLCLPTSSRGTPTEEPGPVHTPLDENSTFF